MKINKNFALRQVAGTWILMPTGDAAQKFNGYLTLNESAVTIWRGLERGASREDLPALLTGEYNVTPEQAAQDVTDLLATLTKVGCLEEAE